MDVGRSASGGEYDLSNPVNSFVDVARSVVLGPARFFAGLPRSANLINPLVFALICIVISALLSGLMVLLGVQENPGFNPNPQNAIPSTFAPASAVASIFFAPIGGGIGLFIVAAIQQLLVTFIVGQNNQGFGSTFKVACYSQVTGLVNWIPIVGPIVALYGLYLSIVGIREMHGTTTGKAALVVLIPFLVVVLIAAIFLVWVGFTVMNQR
ncbi:MAG: YIP1 family protein [Actinomycetota bacterium]|nr:YIP1 family protein [Actinomycetota bacterium]